MNQQPGMPPPLGGMGGMPPPNNPNMPPPNAGGSVTNEELIEAIIDEKWSDLLKDVNKILEWKSQTESRISAMEQEIKDVKDSFDKLHQAVVGKVGEYDAHILDVGSEIKAMEKVFAKILPLFTEKVSELANISEEMKTTMGK